MLATKSRRPMSLMGLPSLPNRDLTGEERAIRGHRNNQLHDVACGRGDLLLRLRETAIDLGSTERVRRRTLGKAGRRVGRLAEQLDQLDRAGEACAFRLG